MLLNRQLRWAGPSVGYSLHSPVARTPAYKHLLLVIALLAGILFAGTSAVVKVLAANQVELQPATSANHESVAPLPTQQPPAVQPAVAAEAPVAKNSSAKVQEVLNSWAASHSGQQWSVVVQGLGSDKTQASLNPNAKYDPASVFKLYFTYTLFKNFNLDTLSKNTVTVTGRGKVSMKDCLDLMIKNSDNPCGEAMGDRLGWGKTTKALKNLGIVNTDLNNPQGLSTTAADINLYLQKLNNGELMAPENQQYLIGLMQQQKYRQGIPAGCNGCKVADKTGDLGSVRHDAGIVQYQGGSYTLAIMTNGVSYSQIAQLTSQIQSAIST
jgi:beta-lactamase class A